MTKLRLENVRHQFVAKAAADALHAVGPASFSLSDGEFLTIVGPSGCGKSTLLRLVAGLITLRDGHITFDGELVTGPSPGRGMVFQQPALFPWLTVERNIAFGARFRSLSRAQAFDVTAELISAVGLEGFETFYPSALSGGMQQRAALARTLAGGPDLLLLDEPFGALDQQTRAKMQVWLAGLLAERGISALLVTHDIEEAVFLSDRVLVMSNRPGRILKEIDIDLPRPRAARIRTDAGFVAVKAEIGAALESESGDETTAETSSR
ncbi:ABC transporter ATP-binding protein [Nisaea denitrificans]|uniref:ABC transporter ATP-binding protein n=1 Tax=Nisaea denitrificans TaxID=390877 RepID=UPI00055DEE17|nr:ABC transporter ATP-binding protein [Nisaea denitrificans]